MPILKILTERSLKISENKNGPASIVKIIPPSQEQKKEHSTNFIAKVKEVFPIFIELHKFLDSGDDSVGSCLYSERDFSMKPDKIVEALENGNQEKILETAKRAKKINELYSEWLETRKK